MKDQDAGGVNQTLAYGIWHSSGLAVRQCRRLCIRYDSRQCSRFCNCHDSRQSSRFGLNESIRGARDVFTFAGRCTQSATESLVMVQLTGPPL